MAEGLGGKLESLYYAFGDVDVHVVLDMHDNASVAAVTLAANQAGSVAVETTVSVTAEEMDAASKKTVDYRPPGT
jgi:uncharacterized protein with GYD domain